MPDQSNIPSEPSADGRLSSVLVRPRRACFYAAARSTFVPSGPRPPRPIHLHFQHLQPNPGHSFSPALVRTRPGQRNVPIAERPTELIKPISPVRCSLAPFSPLSTLPLTACPFPLLLANLFPSCPSASRTFSEYRTAVWQG